jgi:ubiquinone/menaquinone biosynthesis C-methylase UbiE
MSTISTPSIVSLHSVTTIPDLYLNFMNLYIDNIIQGFRSESINIKELTNIFPFLNNCIDHTLIIPSTVMDPLFVQWEQAVKKNIDLDSIIIRIPRQNNNYYNTKALYEYIIGTIINKLRLKVPNFILTLGLVKCSTDKNMTNFVIQEKAIGITFKEWLSTKFSIDSFYIILLQIIFALQKAQDKIGFVHGSLYPENIYVKSSTLESISWQLGSQVYSMKLSKTDYVPYIIDYSSARVTQKGFALSYTQNPTIFTPGKDMFKLLNSCFAILAQYGQYDKINILNKFYRNYYTYDNNTNYEIYYKQYHNFDLDNDHIFANITPIDFITWFKLEQGVLFNRLISTKAREIRLLNNQKQLIPLKDIEKNIKMISSGIVKTYAYNLYDIKYNSTTEEKLIDKEMEKLYLEYHPNNKLIRIDYNFPLNHQYINNKKINIEEYMDSLINELDIVSNYTLFLRYSHSINYPLKSDEKKIQEIYTQKSNLKKTLSLFKNLPLYKLYHLCQFLNGKQADGEYIILLEEWKLLSGMLKTIYPFSSNFLESISTKLVSKEITYYPPFTLRQILFLYQENINLLIDLFYKALGKTIDKQIIIKELEKNLKVRSATDIDILLNMRKYRSNELYDRGQIRALELSKLLPLNFKPNTYLDFGGNTGEISSVIASFLKLQKNNAYSADVDKWFGRIADKKYKNITYITLREYQPIPLPDKSIDLITCYQVLHHIKEVEYIISEFKRVCKKLLIIREHDCRDNIDRTVIDLEHSIYEVVIENDPNIQFLNDYEAYYKSIDEWTDLLGKYGFIKIPHNLVLKYTPTKYAYSVYQISN